MKIRLISVTLLLSMILLQSYSQKPWTLSDCIDYAHASNIQIKRTELQAKIASNNKLQSKINIFPSVNAGFERSYYFGRHLDQGTNQIVDDNSLEDYYGLRANIDLFSGLQNYNRIKKNEFSVLASLQDVEKEKVNITMEIATAYLNILFSKEILEVNKKQLEVTSMQVERSVKLVEAGSIAKGTLLEIQSQLATEKLNVINAQNQLDLSYLNLTQILDLDSVNGFEIVVPESVELGSYSNLPEVKDIYSEALNFLPQIKSAEYTLMSHEKNLNIQKGSLSPTLYASGSIGSRYSSTQEDNLAQDYREQMDVNFSKTIGVGLSIPIFNKWQVKTGIDNAKIQVLDAQYNLDQVKQQLYKEIQQAYNDAVSAHEKYNSATEAVNSYRESFHYTEQKFNVGMVNSVEYNVSKNNFIKAESDLLQAKYEYVFAVKILDFYRGIPITL